MNSQEIHELKLRIWKQPAKKRTEYLSDLDAALLLEGDPQATAVGEIVKRLAVAEAKTERSKQRKEAELKSAEAKLLKDLGL